MNIPHQYQLFTAAESRELDKRTIEEFGIDGFTLMEIAGTRVADYILQQFPTPAKGLFVCGKGNNAGDALVVSRLLAEHGFNLTVVLVDGDENLSPNSKKNYHLLKTLNSPDVAFKNISEAFSYSYDFIVDGMLGTGLNTEVRSSYKNVIELVNELHCKKFSLDVPSGLHADDGTVLGLAIKADVTFALGTLKKGYYHNDGYEYCGKIIYCELPFPSIVKKSSDFILKEDWLKEHRMDHPKPNHKYEHGVVYIIAGSEGLTGAAILSALSAWNTGVGAVILITPKGLLPIYEKHLIHIIKKPVGNINDLRFTKDHLKEVEHLLAEKSGVLLIGPGLGRDKETIHFVQQILSTFEGGTIIDADALYALSKASTHVTSKNSDWILTPHIGELNLLAKSIQGSRSEIANSVCKKFESTILSKGLPSIIVSYNKQTISTDYDTRIFARAGFGDVLAGKIAGYLLISKNRELACCFALSDGKTKAFKCLDNTSEPLEPLDII